MEKISIIFTTWSMNPFRSETMRKSLDSIIKTTKHLPVEIIVIDNGDDYNDSTYLLYLAANKDIQFYIRNSENLYFGFARNQGLNIACGEYVVITDNDIGYEDGWLDKSLKILRAFPERKIAVTPLKTDRIHRQEKYWTEWFEVEGERFPANMKAGSNSWVMRRKDFDVVGRFKNHRVAGSLWTDQFVNSGYTMVTMELAPMAQDMAFKQGYAFKMKVQLKRKFANGEELLIND